MRKIIFTIIATLDDFCDHTLIIPNYELHQNNNKTNNEKTRYIAYNNS